MSGTAHVIRGDALALEARATGGRPGGAPVSNTCPRCHSIHESSAVQAVGRFDPQGVHGYRDARGGPLRPTREQAMADVCARRRDAWLESLP